MNKDIIFRGKRIDNGKWVEGSLVIEYDKTPFIMFWVSELVEPKNNYREMVHKSYEVIPETVGQYIGRKDKKGNKVFIGDILVRKYSIDIGYVDEHIVKKEEKITVESFEQIVLESSRFCGQPYHGNIKDFWKEVVVTGNIHDI